MKRSAPLFTLAVLSSLCFPAAGSAVPNAKVTPPKAEEHWYVVTLQNPSSNQYVPCGHMHTVVNRVGQEVHTTSFTLMEMKRDSASIKVTMKQQSRETLDGKPLGFEHVTVMGQAPSTITGKIANGKITLVEEQFGASQTSQFDFDPEILLPWGQYLEQHRRGLKPGTKYAIKTYEPSMRKDGPIESDCQVKGLETVEVLGKPRQLTHITNTLKLNSDNAAANMFNTSELTSESWVDERGIPIVMTVDLGFMRMKMHLTTQKAALKRGAPPEMFLDTLIRANCVIPQEAQSAKFKLRIKKAVNARMPTMPNTAMQTFERLDDKTAVVTIRRIDWDSLRKATGDNKLPPEVSKLLEPSSSCDSSDNRVKRLARRAVRDAKSPADKADMLRKFVTDYITHKGMNVGFATASEVARNRAGDCSEHGILLAAMARAAGLPARCVSGIVAIPSTMGGDSDRSVLGYHMWTQVYIVNQWTDIDAAMRETECNVSHITVAIMPLAGEGMMNSITPLMSLLGQLEIELMEVNGKPLPQTNQ